MAGRNSIIKDNGPMSHAHNQVILQSRLGRHNTLYKVWHYGTHPVFAFTLTLYTEQNNCWSNIASYSSLVLLI